MMPETHRMVPLNIQDNTGITQENIQDGELSIQDIVNGYAVFRLEADLDRLDSAGIPRDIVFEQGMSVLFGGG